MQTKKVQNSVEERFRKHIQLALNDLYQKELLENRGRTPIRKRKKVIHR